MSVPVWMLLGFATWTLLLLIAIIVFQLQLAKHRNAVPQTRDYITDFDRAAHFDARIAAE